MKPCSDAAPSAAGRSISAPGYVPAQGTFTARAFCASIGWCRRAYRQAKRAGLRVVKLGNKEYIRAADADEFFRRLAEGDGGPAR